MFEACCFRRSLFRAGVPEGLVESSSERSSAVSKDRIGTLSRFAKEVEVESSMLMRGKRVGGDQGHELNSRGGFARTAHSFVARHLLPSKPCLC